MQSLVAIGLLVPEKKIFKDFYHIRAWRPSWSWDPDAANKLLFPLPQELHIQFGFNWPSGFGGEDVRNCGRTTDGRQTDAGP